MTGGAFSVAADSSDATADVGEPAHAGVDAARSLWWQWTAPASGPVRFETSGSSFDTVVAVYRGSSLGSLTLVAANDDAGLASSSCLTFDAVAGESYQIAVDSFTSSGGEVKLVGIQPLDDVVYSSDFAGLSSGVGTLAGHQSWQGLFATNASGILVDSGESLAYLSSEVISGGVAALWLPLNYRLPGTGASKILVSTDWKMIAEAVGAPASFLFLAYSDEGEFLAGLEFDVSTGAILRLDGEGRYTTGATFALGTRAPLDVLVDPTSNTWSARLGNTVLFDAAFFTTAQLSTPSLGSLVAAWTRNDGQTALNHQLLFSDLLVSRADALPPIEPETPPAAAQRQPFGGQRAVIPGKIEAEFFDEGGDGIAYHDTTPENHGGVLRTDGVDIELAPDGGYHIGWFRAEEWLNYAVDVEQSGRYRVSVRVASNGQGGTFRLEIDGVDISGTIVAPDTTGWIVWNLVTFEANFGAGMHDLRVVGLANSAANVGNICNLDWMEFTLLAADPPVTEPPVTDPPTTEPPVTEPPVTDPPTSDPPTSEPPTGEPPTGEPPTGETPKPAIVVIDSPVPTSDGIKIAWPSSAGAARYEIWRSTASDFATAQRVATTFESNFEDVGVVPDTQYTYWVLAYSSDGQLVATGTISAGWQLPPPRLVNLSTRGVVRPEQPMVAGFVIAGNAPRRVLVRAMGPSLDQFGVSEGVAGPIVRLTALATNERSDLTTGWDAGGDVSQVRDAMLEAGAFLPGPGRRDVAWVTSLAPGGYTAEVSNEGGAIGIGLVEVYALDKLEVDDAGELLNISTRGHAGSGAQALIAGFVVSGTTSKRILIRGAGPALTNYGVSDSMTDPWVRVYDDLEELPIAQNDDWSSQQELSAAAQIAGAFQFAAGSKDAAIVLDLEPGVYTAVVAPATGSPGAALVEIYELP